MSHHFNAATTEDQIAKLESLNLIIEDKEFAIKALNTYGYSNLIKSYRDPYVITDINGRKSFRDGVSFEQILSLYLLDKNLRNAVMSSLLDFEELIKTQAADVISFSFGTSTDDYLVFRNYRDKKNKRNQFTLNAILEKLREVCETGKDPVHYYHRKYQDVPPWILFKGIYFGTIVNFIDLFKKDQLKSIADNLYPSLTDLSDLDKSKLMLDTMFICLEYRNLAAHGGRIYNYSSRKQLRKENLASLNPPAENGLSQLLFLLRLLYYPAPFENLSDVLDSEINRHCSMYPQDVTYLSQILNINIQHHEYVFKSKDSNIFHINPYCSGIINPERMELFEARNANLVPCKRCIR